MRLLRFSKAGVKKGLCLFLYRTDKIDGSKQSEHLSDDAKREDSDLPCAQAAPSPGTSRTIYARYEWGVRELPIAI